MLVLVLALICTLAESGRVSAMNARLRSITYMAADSIFAEYAQPMFDEYGVSFLWMDEESLTNKFNKYVSENLNVESTGLKQSLSLYGMQPIGSELKSVVWATDDNGLIFADQACEYMKATLAEDIVDRRLSGLDIFSQGDKVKNFIDRIDKYKEVFLSVEKSIEQINEKVNQAKNLSADPKAIISDISNLLDEYTVTGSSQTAAQINAKINQLKNTKNQIISSLEQVKQKTSEYNQKVETAKGVVKTLEGELSLEKEDYTEEIYEIVKGELDEIKAKAGADATDYYNINGNMAITQNYINELNGLESFFNLTSNGINFDSVVTYKNAMSMYRQKFSDFNIDKLGINFENIESQKESSSFIDSIEALFQGGVLSLVAGEISTKGIETKELPSKTMVKVEEPAAVSSSEKNDNVVLGLAGATAQKVLLSEYVLKNFGNLRTVKEESALDYEAEYVVVGKGSDRENLEAVLADIVLIRSSMNLISLLKDEQKKSEALALATAIIGFTGQPIFIEIVKYVILSTWALAESIADAKALVDGKKVPTIKSAAQWNVSIAGLKNFGSEQIVSRDCESGLAYEDYLRLLLVTQNTGKQCFRDMDIIQANMCKREHADFRFKDCIASIKIETAFRANQVFVAFPFISQQLDFVGGGYAFKYLQEYSY